MPLSWTASEGVSTAPSLQHYPENNEDEDDEEEQEEDLYREYFSQCLFRDNMSGCFHIPSLQRYPENNEAEDDDDLYRAWVYISQCLYCVQH